jgi:hypothetical protein
MVAVVKLVLLFGSGGRGTQLREHSFGEKASQPAIMVMPILVTALGVRGITPRGDKGRGEGVGVPSFR